MKIRLILCIIVMAVLLAGCWDYTSLDTLAIVAGAAVDKNSDGTYRITFETVDKEGSDEKGPFGARLISEDGLTLFDAARAVEKKLVKQLYFGDMQLLIVSEQVAREDGIKDLMEELFREAVTRETISVVVSLAETAEISAGACRRGKRQC